MAYYFNIKEPISSPSSKSTLNFSSSIFKGNNRAKNPFFLPEILFLGSLSTINWLYIKAAVSFKTTKDHCDRMYGFKLKLGTQNFRDREI